MATPKRSSEVQAVDAFLLEPKRLREGLPLWVQPEYRMREIHATWLIIDLLGSERAQPRFRCPSLRRKYPSVSVIFRTHTVWRVDIVPPNECKYNPIWAERLGLPSTVCGPHGHEWPDNRDHLLKEHTTWVIPCRRPLPPGIRRLEQVLPWLCDRVGIELLPEQRGFEVPPQHDLFS